MQILERLVRDGVLSNLDFSNFETCVVCLKGKMTAKTRKEKIDRCGGILDLIHIDICGPLTPTALGEEKGSDATGDHDRIVVNDGSILQWAHVLEPVMELPTNGEIKIRKCIYEALERVQRLMRRIRDISQYDEFDESDESNFTSASNDMVASPNNEQCMGPPSDDSEDGDHNPNAPEIDEQVNQESSSSDFASDSEDFTATLDRRNFSDDEDGLDGQRRFGRKKKDTLKDAFIEDMKSEDLVSYTTEGVKIVGEEKFLVSDSFLGSEKSKYCLT
uniref:Uncharacterized protein n=1 Tax=Vitis vinifera TaxID=29760 RepID=F6GV72_VITVI